MKEQHNAKWVLKYIYMIKSSSIPHVEAQIELLENMLKYLTAKRENYLKEITELRESIK